MFILGVVDKTDEIHKARKLVDMTQKQLARRLGISKWLLSRYELGYQPIPLSLACRIADEVGQPFDILFYGAQFHAA